GTAPAGRTAAAARRSRGAARRGWPRERSLSTTLRRRAERLLREVGGVVRTWGSPLDGGWWVEDPCRKPAAEGRPRHRAAAHVAWGMCVRRRRLEGPPRLVFGGREPLVEEAPEQKDGAYCEERECTRHCAERRQVVEEDLGEADGEEGESRHPDRARVSLQ